MSLQSNLELARNPNTPPELLEELFNDNKNYYIFQYLAYNPNTPDKCLDILAFPTRNFLKSSNCYFRHSFRYRVAQNPSVSHELLEKIIECYLNLSYPDCDAVESIIRYDHCPKRLKMYYEAVLYIKKNI